MSEKGWIQSLGQEEEKDPTSPQQTKPTQQTGIISGLAAPAPAAQEPSILDEAGKGLAHGVIGLAEAVGTGIEYAGGKLGDKELVDFGDNIQQYWKEANKRYETDPSLQGSVIENPELMTKGAWWAYNSASIVPSIAASFIPGAASHKAITIGGKAMQWTPALVTKLARLGSAVVGGAVGGSLEGANTYEEVLAKGGSREEAESAAEKMALASGVLNALSVDRWLKALPDDVKGRLIARGVRGLTEGITEWLEGPAEAAIMLNEAGKEGAKVKYTPEEAMQKIKDELNVLGPSALVGMFFPGAGKLGGQYAERTEQQPTGPMSAAAAPVSGRLMPLDQDAAMRRAQTLTQQGVPHGVVPHPQATGKFGVVPIDEGLLAEQATPAEEAGVEISSDQLAAEMGDEHRRNLALRTAIDHMSPEERGAAIEELRQMALTSRLTGLRNKDAFAEMFGEKFDADGRPPFIMQIDSDSLKTVNDLMGHQNGDALLRATGIAIAEELQDLGESDIEAFHFSGDEFGLTGSDSAMMEQVAKGAQERLKQAILYGKTPDGRDVELHGLGFSYGVSGSLEESEHALARNKAEREVTGERAPRGEEPAGLRFPGGQEPAGEGGAAAEEGKASQQAAGAADWGRVLASKKADLSEEAIKLLSEERPTREMTKPTGKAVSLAKVGETKERFTNFANDLYKDDRVFTNPITGSAVVMREGGTRDDFADVAVRPWQDGVMLESIITIEHGRGNASAGLDKVIELADKHGLPIYLTAQPFGTNQGMTKAQLKNWYRGRGFRATGGDEMKREPGGLSSKKTQGEQKRVEQLRKAKPKKEAVKKKAAKARKLAPSVQPGHSREIVEQAAAQAAHSPKNAKTLPTKGQRSAGNYQKGHFRLHGADMAIENPKGSVRTGVGPKGKRWSQEIKHHYGYIKRTTGKDGDQLDFFMGPNPDSKIAFVVDQKKENGKFDEHKAMLGFQSEEEATKAYHANYEPGWKGMKGITPMPIDKFMEWKDQYTHREAAKAGPKFMFSEATSRSLNSSAERRKMLEIAENEGAAQDYWDQQMEEHDFYDDWQSDSSPETGFLPDDAVNEIAEQTFDHDELFEEYKEFKGDEELEDELTTLEMLREMDRVDEIEYDVSDLEGVWDEIEYFFTDASQYSGPTVAVYRDTDYGFMVIADNGNSIDEIELTRVAEEDVAEYIDSSSAESRYKQLIEEELGDDWSVDEMYEGLALISGTVEGYAASIIETKDGGYSGEIWIPGEEYPRQVDGYSMDDILGGLQSEAEDAGDRSTITMQYRDIDGDIVENEIAYAKDDDGTIEIVSINEDEDVESQVYGEAELERIKQYIATEGKVGQFAKHTRRKVKGAKDYQMVVDRAVETAKQASKVFGAMPSQKRQAVFTERDRLMREVFARQFGLTGENPRIDAMMDALGRPGNEMPDGDLLHLAAPWGEEIPGGHDPIQVEIDHNLDEERIELYDVNTGKLVAEFSLEDISVATANAALELLDGRAEVPPLSPEQMAEDVSAAKSKLDNAIKQFDTQSLETYAKQLAKSMYSGSTQEFVAEKAKGIIEEARRQIDLMVHRNVFQAAEMLSKAETILAEIDKPDLAISRSNMAGWGRRETPLSYFFPHFGNIGILTEAELEKAREVQQLYVQADKLLEAAGYYSRPAEGWNATEAGPMGSYRTVADRIIFGAIMRNARAGSRASAAEFSEATKKMMSKQFSDVVPSINQDGTAKWNIPTDSVDLANIIVEAIPAPSTGSPLVSADFSTKLAYTEDAMSVIVKDGRNLLVDAISGIGRTVPGAGSFEGEISPNTITQVLQGIVEEAGRTIHAREQADLLALSNIFLFHQQAVPWLRFDPAITIDTIPEGEVFHRGVAIELKSKPDSTTLQSLYSGIRGVMPGTEFTVIGNKLVAINFRDGETNTPYSGIDDKVFADTIHEYVDTLDVASGFIDDIVAEGAYHDISFLGGDWANPEAAKNILAKEIGNRGGLGLVKRLRTWEREIATITAKHEATLKGEGFQLGTAKGSMSASPVITDGVELSRWPEGGADGPIAIRLGKARITGRIEDGAILVKMVTGMDTTEIDVVLRDMLRKAADEKVGTIVVPRKFAKKSEFLASLLSMQMMKTLEEVEGSDFYGSDVIEFKIGEHIPQPAGTGITLEHAEYLVGLSGEYLNYDPDSWSVPKTIDPESVTDDELQQYGGLFRYPRHSGVEAMGGQQVWVDAQIPNIDQQRVLVSVMESLEAAGFPAFTDIGIDAVGSALFEMDGMNGVYIPSENRTYLSGKLIDAALMLEDASALQYLTEYLAHEASHFIDYRGTNESLSFFSPLFEFDPTMFNIQSETNATLDERAGDVIRELFNFYNDRANDLGVHDMLNYPFNSMPRLYEAGEHLAAAAKLKQLGLVSEQEFNATKFRYFQQQDFVITEAFAQLSAIYYTHRGMVERELPNSFKFMEAIRDASNRLATEGDGPLRAVFSAPNTAAIPAVNVAGGAAKKSTRGPGEGRASAGVGAGPAYQQPSGRIAAAAQAQQGGQGSDATVAPRWSLVGSEIWSGLATEQGVDLKQVGDKLRGMKEEDFYDTPPASIDDLMDGLDFDELSIMAESAKKLGSTDPIMLEVMRVDAGRETRLQSYEREALAEYVKYHDVAIHDRSPNRENIVSTAVSPTRSGGTVTVGSTNIYNEHPDHWVGVYGPEKEDGSGQDLMWERKYDSPEDATLAYLLLKNAYQPRITIPDASQAATMSLEDFVADTTGETAKVRSSQHREAAKELLRSHIKAWESYYKAQEKAQAEIDLFNRNNHLFGDDAITIDTLEEDVLIGQDTIGDISLKEALSEAAGAFELVVDTNIPEFMDRDYPDLKREATKARMKFIGGQKSRVFRSRKQRRELIDQADYNTQFIPSINSDERMHWNVSDHQGNEDNKASLSGEEPVTDTGRQGRIADAAQTGWRHYYTRYQQQAGKALDWLTDKFAWASPLGSNMKDVEQYMAKRGITAGRIAKVNQVVKRMGEILKNVTPEEMPAVFEYLTTAGATSQNLPSRMVKIKRIRGAGVLFRQPKEVNLAKEIVAMKRLIRGIGRQLAERGLIPPMSYEHFKDAYLPRIYLAHILDETTFRALGSGRKVSQLGYTKMRDEGMPELERIIMGEIKDAAYLAPKTVGTTLRDMAILDFIEEISRNDNWILPQIMVPFNGKRVSAYWLESEANAIMQRLEYMSPADAKIAEVRANQMQKLAQASIGKASEVTSSYEGYKQVPNTPRYGVLRGMFVKEAIFDDIIGSMQTTVDDSVAGKLLDQGGLATRLTQIWKTSKVAANPPSQIRNFTSNMIQLHLSGVPMLKIPDLMLDTIKEIRNNGKYWRLAQKHGITESTFAASELWRLERSLLDLKKDGKPHPIDAIMLTAGKAADVMGDAYQFSEALGKTMVMKYFMEQEGYTAEQAAAHANKWLFDYSFVPPTVRYLRNAPVGVPFITFYYKALPRMLEAAITHPERFTPYVAIPYILAQALAHAYDVDDDDLEKLKKALPMWIQERGHALIIPWKDGNGRWQAFDYGYYLPWGMYWDAIKDVANGEVGDFIKTTGLFGGPIPEIISAIKTGQDSFTGRPIYHDADPAGQQMWDIFNYTWRLAMPTWITDIGAASHIYSSVTGKVNPRTGEPMLTMPQATLRMFGANVYPIDPEYTRAKNMQYMAYDIKDTQQRLRSMLMDQNLSQKQRENIRDQYFELMKHRAEELAKYREESEVHPNLRTRE